MINWAEFEKLPGGPQHNFEILCRSLIRLHYGRYGQFAALANQPGVEFHLLLQEQCALGNSGRWFGWQCRWYDLPGGKALGSARRRKIEEALARSVKAVPGLTDWILWTRRPLTAADQEWFYALNTSMRLTLWIADDAETLLSGEAEILRRTYFGELLLTPATLAHQHELSVAQIRKRWLPEAHQPVDAERRLRRMLGEAESWSLMNAVARRLLAAAAAITGDTRASEGPLRPATHAFISGARSLAAILQEVYRLLESGDLELLRQRLDSRLRRVSRESEIVARRLRAARLAAGLIATNALADMRLGIRLLADVDSLLGTRLVSVLADAGGGKTQLAAQLTAELPDRPAGVLLHGRDLHSGRTLNDLAETVVIQGRPVQSIEALLAALDAAGQRARRRIPLVIDGLNEAEDPREWKTPLASLDALLRRFANVLVVCTLRTGARRPVEQRRGQQGVATTTARAAFAAQALPESVERIEIADFAGDTKRAIRKYFEFFRINPGDAEVPFELLGHPLTLRIFCEVSNPDRKREVGIEAMPRSLTGLFERYVTRAIERIGELAPRNRRYYEHDIRSVLDVIGIELWDKVDRELPEQELRRAIGDDARPWNESIIHMLEQEGLVLRIPGETAGRQSIIPVYDALGGYIVGEALLTKHGRAGLGSWLEDPQTLNAFTGEIPNLHPLAMDIFQALVGLLPRRLRRQQLWQLLQEPLRGVALRLAASLEGTYLDATTVSAIGDALRQSTPASKRMFRRLFDVRGAVGHPLNAQFLDSVLRMMPVSDRDLLWTEWLRENCEAVQKDIELLEEGWKNNLTSRGPSDELRAKWIMWGLTTTVRSLRDRITRALYWFGRGNPSALFEQARETASINDPYVFERVIAASYGVALAVHSDSRQASYAKTTLPKYARQIFDLLFKMDAPYRTTHVLIRDYARRYIEIGSMHNRKMVSVKDLGTTCPPYSDGGRLPWSDVPTNAEDLRGIDSPFRMDFENYTLGRLAEGRGNYDYKHPGYQRIRSQILWRVRQLGWSAERFGRVDQSIEADRNRYYRRVEEHSKVDRYGKKYSWIAYFELGGWLRDEGVLADREESGRSWDVDIDPSFPDRTKEVRLISADLLEDSEALSLSDWIKGGPVPDLAPYLRQDAILGESGPWIALDGYVDQHDEHRGRHVFAFVRSFLVSKKDAQTVLKCLGKQRLGGRWLPEKPECRYTFAGEVPWCDTFPNTRTTLLEFIVDEQMVKVRRRRPFFFLDGKPVNLSEIDVLLSRIRIRGLASDHQSERTQLTDSELSRLELQHRVVEIEEVVRKVRKFGSVIPVCDFAWEGHDIDNHPMRGIALTKRLAKRAGLVHLPQTHDLQDRHGVRATYGTAYELNGISRNTERFFFIRENVLRNLLQDYGSVLIYAVWGERQRSYKLFGRVSDKEPDAITRADFQVIRYASVP
jgi:hypothetical protein